MDVHKKIYKTDSKFKNFKSQPPKSKILKFRIGKGAPLERGFFWGFGARHRSSRFLDQDQTAVKTMVGIKLASDV